jgi:hypothetical protein
VPLSAVLCGIAHPHIVNAPSKIANKWFEPKSRPAASIVMGLANSIGIAIGFCFPLIFVEEDAEENPLEGKDMIETASLFVAVLMTIISIVGILLYRESPPTPPR